MSKAARNHAQPGSQADHDFRKPAGTHHDVGAQWVVRRSSHGYRLYALRKAIRRLRAVQEGRSDRRGAGSADGPGKGLDHVHRIGVPG